MSSRKVITLDHYRNFFSLDTEIQPLDVAPTATGGLGINNLRECPPPEPRQMKITRGTAYAEIERQKEAEMEKQLNYYTKPASGEAATGLDALEEVSTITGDTANCNDFASDDVQALYSTYYKNKVQYNADLPITSYKEQLLQLININRVVIVQGSTGCGKTTQVPQFILDYKANLNQNCNIAVTQPRRIAAISVAKRVCQERKWQLGTIVGYQVGLDSCISQDTRITYFTTGVLLQKLVNDRQITKYTHIIIDEVHERDQDTDFVLLVVKKLMLTNSPHVKIILMSATIDTQLFANYFSLRGRNDPAPIIEIQGKVQNVDEYYIEGLSKLQVTIPEFDPNVPRLPDELYELVKRLMCIFDRIEKCEQDEEGGDREFASERGAILIFLPGYDEISRMHGVLKVEAFTRKYTILPLHSTMTGEEQSRVFDPPSKTFRKVILSTNIAESSITVPDIKYVIDFCLTKSMVCDPVTNYCSLKLEWASKSNCIQRKGRAGRLSPGRVYRLVPEKFYETYLRSNSVPEIKRCPLTQLVLYAKKLNIAPPIHLLALAIDPPEQYGIEHAVLTLKEVGALAVTCNGQPSSVDGDLTFVGRVMAQLPLDVKLSKLIIMGYVFGCLEECIIIAASLSLRNFFVKSFQKQLDYYKSILSWADGSYSDCLAFLNAYNTWKELSVSGCFHRPGGQNDIQWGQTNFIQIRRIREVDLLVKDLTKRLEKMNIKVSYTRRRNESHQIKDVMLLKAVIAGAFFPNYYIQDELDEKNMLRDVSNGDVYSTVYISGLPANHGVLYFHSIEQMMSICSTRMAIEFEERKAYIQFDRRGLEGNPAVHPAVYFAVKMRLMRMPLTLQVFKHEDAERRMMQLKNIQRQLHGYSRTLSTKRLMVQPTSYALKKIDLPPLGQLTITIYITHVVDCGHFWARYADQATTNLIVFIENSINASVKSLLPVEEPLACGSLVLAPFAESKTKVRYFRAVVEEMYDDRVIVFYIDYGNTNVLNRTDLRQIDYEIAPDVRDTPALAFECKLCQIRPSAIMSFQWTKEAFRFFKSVTQRGTHNARVYSVVQNIVRLELFGLHPDGRMYNIKDELIDMGFGEEAEESLLSRENYELRMKWEQQQSAMSVHEEEFKPFQLTTKDLIGTEQVMKTSNRISLHGPYSPLEVTYSGMTYLDHHKTIKVDPDSINSVSLNQEPQDKTPQMLVAGAVSLKQNSDSLTVRSTTLMPKIKGLPSLLALIFSPYVEFRADPERKAYTGALCGLGYEEDSPKHDPLYPDHDIEIVFDVAIDYQDITEINAIRMGINVMLNWQNDTSEMNPSMLGEIQKNLRKSLLTLLKRKRKAKEPENFSRIYEWDQVNPEYFLAPKFDEDFPNIPHILPIHKCINLVAEASLAKELKDHLKMLYDLASSSTVPVDITCRLCNVVLKSPRCLMIHLDSAKHRERQALLASQ